MRGAGSSGQLETLMMRMIYMGLLTAFCCRRLRMIGRLSYED